MNNKKLIMIMAGAISIMILIVVFAVTKPSRERNEQIKEIQQEISDYRNNSSEWIMFYISNDVARDSKFLEYIKGCIHEICVNKEFELLNKLLNELVDSSIDEGYLNAIIQEEIDNMAMLEDVYEMYKVVTEYISYEEECELKMPSRDSKAVSSYIEKNGTEEIEIRPGYGYYAKESDSSSTKRMGLSDSPLYSSRKSEYFGDFEYVHKEGVELDRYYSENKYSYDRYYFRGKEIDFKHTFGECVLSGDYLFCFDTDGETIGCAKINE